MTTTVSRSTYPLKRAIDIVVGTTLLAAASPIMVVVAIAILLEDGKPILFRQVRVGQNGKTYTILKFRSMRRGTSNVPSALQDADSVTKVGNTIRRWSLDELPQIWNVLKGDMSLVGPRPALPAQQELLHLRKTKQVDVLKPGLTGWAQVCSYDGMPDSEKTDLDATYATRMSLKEDLKIFAFTIRYLLSPPPKY